MGIFLFDNFHSQKSDKNKNVTETMKGGLLPDPVFLQDELMNTPLAKKLCEQYPDCKSIYSCACNVEQ